MRHGNAIRKNMLDCNCLHFSDTKAILQRTDSTEARNLFRYREQCTQYLYQQQEVTQTCQCAFAERTKNKCRGAVNDVTPAKVLQGSLYAKKSGFFLMPLTYGFCHVKISIAHYTLQAGQMRLFILLLRLFIIYYLKVNSNLAENYNYATAYNC